MMTRRTLLKLIASLPFIGPTVAKALTQAANPVRPFTFPYLPPNFPKWSKAVDGLEDAGAWGLDFERLHLPSNLVFPHEGEVWEAVRDLEISVLPRVWKHPWTLATAHIKAGERVRVVHLDGPKPVYVSFVRLAAPADVGATSDAPSDSELRLKTTKTLADVVQHRGDLRVFFLEAFKRTC